MAIFSMQLILILATSFLFAVIQSQNCTWTAWSDWSECSAYCGNCGNQTRTRNCTGASATCSCSGNRTELERCNDDVCVFPRKTCCVGAAASVDGLFKCA